MMRDAKPLSRWRNIRASLKSHGNAIARQPGRIALHTLIYIALAAISIATATAQPNAAAVWAPSGYAIGLLLVRGASLWPAIALGSLVFNFAINALPQNGGISLVAFLVALIIAVGNAGEAIVGSYLARRYASGKCYLFRSRTVFYFLFLVVPIPPLISTLLGVSVSRWGGISAAVDVPAIATAWYIANSVGILVFCGLTVLVLRQRRWKMPRRRLAEAIALFLCLGIAGEAICGYYVADWLKGWPKAYMVIPLLLWACFRFGTGGGLVSIAFVTVIAAIGTMTGFTVFAAPTITHSLIYLQIFLGLLAVMTLSISAVLAEAAALRASLANGVKVRTQEIERLLRSRDVFTNLVAHDLQSPIYGIRNALRATAAGIDKGLIGEQDLKAAFTVMDEACTTLAERVRTLLDQGRASIRPNPQQGSTPLVQILGKIASAHRTTLHLAGSPSATASPARLVYEGDRNIFVYRAEEIEHILEALIDNAMKYSPDDAQVHISGFHHSGNIEIGVRDQGSGVPPADIARLFQPHSGSIDTDRGPSAGLGLYLASEQAAVIGGRLSYTPASPNGSLFRLTFPA